ncbi:MAG TPA: GntR family transcriptional regulator [Candidatus Saccharimonadales bacterium]|nr:GntR family transcriptional regulator [Candidatus Saccharimonadales bacterium]
MRDLDKQPESSRLEAGTAADRLTTAQFVARHLREAIARGDLMPGARLRQNEIAAQLGVSTTPVREAFGTLQAIGLVRIDSRRGAVVASSTEEEINEAYEIRLALESLATAKGILHLHDHDFEQMERLLDDMDRASSQDEWLSANNRFHLSIYSASGMPNLCSLIQTLRDSSTIYLQIFLTVHGRNERPQAEHQAILEACRARDVGAAIEALRQHLHATERSVLEVIRNQARDRPR